MKWELGALKILAKQETVPGAALADAIGEIEKLRDELESVLKAYRMSRSMLSKDHSKGLKMRLALAACRDWLDNFGRNAPIEFGGEAELSKTITEALAYAMETPISTQDDPNET